MDDGFSLRSIAFIACDCETYMGSTEVAAIVPCFASHLTEDAWDRYWMEKAEDMSGRVRLFEDLLNDLRTDNHLNEEARQDWINAWRAAHKRVECSAAKNNGSAQ